jgi:threonine synthase
MSAIYQEYGYMLDPHGAVGMLGIEKYLRDNTSDAPGIFLETAHPAKFLDVVKSAVNTEPILPEALKKCLDKPKTSIKMENDYKELEKILAERYL